MSNVRTRKGFIALMLVIMLLMSGISVNAASSGVSIKKYSAPTTLKTGQKFVVKGTVSSTQTIKRIEVGIVNSSGKWTSYKYDNKKVNAKSFNLSKADKKLKFGKLAEGIYYYRIYVHTADGKTHTVLDQKFTVKTPRPVVSDCTQPDELKIGKGFSLKGKITSDTKMTKVEIGVVNADTGKWTAQKYTTNPKAKTFNISKADSAVHFGRLECGFYTYRIVAKTSYGTFTLVDKSFSVVDPESENNLKSESPNIKLSGCNAPVIYNVGKDFKVKGTVNAEEGINRIEAGIVFEPTNKWTDYKYDSPVIGKTFNLNKVASTLQFSKLPGGTYYYRVYVHTESGVWLAINRKFKVRPSNKPQAAVDWAVNIANDDTFNYGEKPIANAIGCYFCGTNEKKVKNSGGDERYAKTYVCMTFVGAAYAHGAGDPDILKACQRGKMTLYETNDNFTKFSCWMKIGACKDLTIKDLMPGDVVIDWSDHNDNNGHAFIYIGNNNLVEASGGGWGANSIGVKTGTAATRLARLGSDSRNYVMRYIH